MGYTIEMLPDGILVTDARGRITFANGQGRLLWDEVGMARNDAGLRKALARIPQLRDEFWQNVSVPGEPNNLNKNLEYAGRVADELEDLIGQGFDFVHVDSWEAGDLNFTPKFIEEFLCPLQGAQGPDDLLDVGELETVTRQLDVSRCEIASLEDRIMRVGRHRLALDGPPRLRARQALVLALVGWLRAFAAHSAMIKTAGGILLGGLMYGLLLLVLRVPETRGLLQMVRRRLVRKPVLPPQ